MRDLASETLAPSPFAPSVECELPDWHVFRTHSRATGLVSFVVQRLTTDLRRPPADLTLTFPAPRVSRTEAEAIVAERYGFVAAAKRLAGEKDDNFVLRSERGSCFLKVVHPAEPREVTDLCTKVLLALDSVPDLPVQKVIPTRDGYGDVLLETRSGHARGVRLTSYLDGRILKTVPSRPPLRANLGRVLGRLGQELKHFRHLSASRPLLWDLSQADQLRPLLDDLDGRVDREVLLACLDWFDADTLPRLAQLRRQIVHNDLSADNVLIADDGVNVVGIIDFGDVVATQLINDVAVAVTNQLGDGDDPMGPALDVVRGFHSVEPLTRPELELLYDLVRLRTVTRIIISEWWSLHNPDNRAYIMQYTARAWVQLRNLPTSAAPTVSHRLITACQLD